MWNITLGMRENFLVPDEKEAHILMNWDQWKNTTLNSFPQIIFIENIALRMMEIKASDESTQLFRTFQCHFPIYVQHYKTRTLGRCFWGSKFNDYSIINSRGINGKIFEDICETDFTPSSHSRGIVFISDRLTSGQNFQSVDSAYDWIIYFS